MTEPKTHPVLSPPVHRPISLRTALLAWSSLPRAMSALMRACEVGRAERVGPALLEVDRVESAWELIDDASTAHGFVLALRDGRRCYLQYVMTADAGAIDEDVVALPMRDERYPDLKGGGVVWDDRGAAGLNSLLNA
jgi:hypothetical protein